jgi:hypothetical protein
MENENYTRVEMRTGESTDKVKARRQEEKQIEMERSDADKAEIGILSMMHNNDTNQYSETFVIKPNGGFDDIREDGKERFLNNPDTSEELYKIAAEIQKKNDKLHFNFETDPEGKWIKYTVRLNQ